MADYNDFPESPSAGDIVDKNGRTWYYDGTKWVLFVDPKNTGAIRYSDVPPMVLDATTESTNNPIDPDEVRTVVESSIDLTKLDLLDS